MYLSADNDFNNQSNALVSIIGKGKIIYDKNGSIAALQKYILAKYSQPLPPIIADEAKEMVCIIDNLIIRLQKMAVIQDPEFDHIYHLTIEKIRKFYHRLLGCLEVPVEKASLIYNDLEYRKSFSKGEVPELEFREFRAKLVLFQGTIEEKASLIIEFYQYAKRNIKIDPEDYRILIKSRNDPNNYNHRLKSKHECLLFKLI